MAFRLSAVVDWRMRGHAGAVLRELPARRLRGLSLRSVADGNIWAGLSKSRVVAAPGPGGSRHGTLPRRVRVLVSALLRVQVFALLLLLEEILET